MSAAARPNTVWKADLLAGRLDPQVAVAAGSLLGTLHAGSWDDASIAALENQPVVDQLLIARLKRKKLVLRDKIVLLEDQITPDIIA